MIKTKLASTVTAATSPYDDMPLSIVLFRFLWPFWLFQDASRGDRLDRAAAYQHNRDMRIYLPGYLLKWMLSCAVTFAITVGLDSLAREMTGQPNLWALMAAGSGMVFACGICILVLTTYIYIYLSRQR